jgi:hypothetical protein
VPSFSGADMDDKSLTHLVNHFLKYEAKNSKVEEITANWKKKNEHLYPEDWSTSSAINKNDENGDEITKKENNSEKKIPSVKIIEKSSSVPLLK